MFLRHVNAVRYVAPLREGGSLPILLEADDSKLYVAKMRGAGQGALALVSEIITGEIARLLGLRVPEIVFAELNDVFALNERDAEIRDLLRKSAGTNAALGFLEGATTFDPAAGDTLDAATASLVVWLDAFTMNVDRTPRNPNMLCQRGDMWLIDHGASLYFHHNWPTAESKIVSPFAPISDHVLLRWASDISSASALAKQRLKPEALIDIVQLVPVEWMVTDEMDEPEARARYVDFLRRRLENSSIFEQEVRRVRKNLI